MPLVNIIGTGDIEGNAAFLGTFITGKFSVPTDTIPVSTSEQNL